MKGGDKKMKIKSTPIHLILIGIGLWLLSKLPIYPSFFATVLQILGLTAFLVGLIKFVMDYLKKKKA